MSTLKAFLTKAHKLGTRLHYKSFFQRIRALKYSDVQLNSSEPTVLNHDSEAVLTG